MAAISQPTQCRVCLSPAREEIEEARRRGVSLKTLASRYGMSSASVARHEKHALSGAGGLVPAGEPVSAGEHVERLDASILAVLRKAEEERNSLVVLAAVREARAMLETRFRIGHQLAQDEERRHRTTEQREADAILWMREHEPAVHLRYVQHLLEEYNEESKGYLSGQNVTAIPDGETPC